MSDRRGPVYFAFAQQKGGCAKTVSACWLSWLIALKHRVVLVDLDPQGSATALLGKSDTFKHGAYDMIVGGNVPKDSICRSRIANCMLVPATDELIMAEMDARVQGLAFEDARARFMKIFDSFDYVIFDCGAGLGILPSLAMTIADRTIIPQMPGDLERRATHATLRHLGRLRADVASSAIVLPVMQDADYLDIDASLPMSSTTIPFDPDGAAEKFLDMAGYSAPDTSDAMIAAYYALFHELEAGNSDWHENVMPEPTPDVAQRPESIEKDNEEASDTEEIDDSIETSSPRPESGRFAGPEAETMTDIFDALHQKRSKQRDQEQAAPAAEPQQRESARPKQNEARQSAVKKSEASASAPPTYQSLRDIHQDTLEEAPKTRSMFWLRLGLALIAVGVAVIGIFTDLVGPLTMWTAIGAMVILFIPDLIFKFIIKDR